MGCNLNRFLFGKQFSMKVKDSHLIRYLFDVPYTRKDGTRISVGQIFQMKENAQIAYDEGAGGYGYAESYVGGDWNGFPSTDPQFMDETTQNSALADSGLLR